ncbi:hypothetical protein NHH88_04295 [Oxalobacteraceae bacterium OTU3CAMAD1]|nr:hypothetical protein NHH88_04295 [Oxalobacteraceae bacterium OTU3CAMAD1]
MKRATKNPSKIFQQILAQAEDQLALAARSAANFQHRGIRGDERAEALGQFLAMHLPQSFSVGKGEVVDYLDTRTGQLDLFVYDSSTASPLLAAGENTLLPAEALYAVIEVKSVLTQAELNKCAVAAAKLRDLKPFKHKFSPSPMKGEAPADCHRCPYIVFAYTTDLSEEDWAQKEFHRVKVAVQSVGGEADLLDRVIVLNRGMLRPQIAAARVKDEENGVFLDFYIHLMSFLMKERRRRPLIDLLAYVSTGKWVKLKCG